MPKVSKIFEDKKLINSKAYNSLSPVMKEAVNDMFKMINNKGNIILNVENAVDKVAELVLQVAIVFRPAIASSTIEVTCSLTAVPHVPLNSPCVGRASFNMDVYCVAI